MMFVYVFFIIHYEEEFSAKLINIPFLKPKL